MTKPMLRASRAALMMALALPLMPAAAFAQDSAATTAPATEISAETVIATVNGQPLTLGRMLAVREEIGEQAQGYEPKMIFDTLLDQMIQQEIVAQSIEKLSPRNEAYLANFRQAYLANAALQPFAEAAVTDEALQKLYDETFVQAPDVKELNAAHILVKTEDEAKAILTELENGGDFADLARKNSTDTGSGSNGGDLGWFAPEMMVKPFADAASAAEIGKVAGPVESQFGFHLILVKETRIAEKPSLEEVRAQLAADIEQAAVKARVDELTAAAKIEKPGLELDPSVLDNTALID